MSNHQTDSTIIDEEYGLLAIARIKKPHRHFLPGDLVVGIRMDGMADNLVCWGWSSKHKKIVGGKYGYRFRYCGWESLAKRYRKAAENAKFDNVHQYSMNVPNGRGHLRIVKWFHGKTFSEDSPQLRNAEWLRRLLIELSCGNMPLTREEATPSKRPLFLTDGSL